jgi:SAM-dependent methyltransferase
MGAGQVAQRRRARSAPSRTVRRKRTREAPESTVRKGWNRLSTTYRPPGAKSDFFLHTDAQYREWLSPLVASLELGAPVLELGCGTGEPASVELANHFDLTGLDISDVMIRRARSTVRSGRFIRADMTKVDFPAGSFQAIVSLYAIIHVPLAKQKRLLARIHAWLAPGGLFLATLGHDAWEGTERGWLGVDTTMFWSHADAATYRRWLHETGFTILSQEFVPEGAGGHELFLVRKVRSGVAGSPVARGPTDPRRGNRSR